MSSEPQAKGQQSDVTHWGKVGDIKLLDVPAVSECNPGIQPTEYNVILAPAVMPQRVGSILLADSTREQRADAVQVARIIAKSPIAFNYERWPDGTSPPEVGDIVWYARYAGGEIEGLDGRTYRIVKDKDIGAIFPVPPVDEWKLPNVASAANPFPQHFIGAHQANAKRGA